MSVVRKRADGKFFPKAPRNWPGCSGNESRNILDGNLRSSIVFLLKFWQSISTGDAIASKRFAIAISVKVRTLVVRANHSGQQIKHCSHTLFFQAPCNHSQPNECIFVILRFTICPCQLESRLAPSMQPLTEVHDLLIEVRNRLPNARHDVLLKINSRDRKDTSSEIKQGTECTPVVRISSIVPDRGKRSAGHDQAINWSTSACDFAGLLPSLKPLLCK